MAKATAKKKLKAEEMMHLPVSFGSVSSGKKTCRVGINVDREHIKLPLADQTFCDRRLTVTIVANANGDQPGQGRLDGMDDSLELIGVADVKGFGVHATTIGFGLTFNKQELRKAFTKTGVQFADFAAREGSLMIAEVGEIPEEDKTNAEDNGEEGGEE